MKYLISLLVISLFPSISYASEKEISEELIYKTKKSIKFTSSPSKMNKSMHTLFVEIPKLNTHPPIKCNFSVSEWNDSFFNYEQSPIKTDDKWFCHVGIELKSPYIIVVQIKYENIDSIIEVKYKS